MSFTQICWHFFNRMHRLMNRTTVVALFRFSRGWRMNAILQ
ncbi:hypothetical protein HMPREF9536_01748 [Escherichia coli MS 84-1]|nr:hypothetical protein HMPREF9536_01748 [Escherichia coli MS 84-1]